MQLSWTANGESDIAGYKVYYDTDGSGYPYANSVSTGSTGDNVHTDGTHDRWALLMYTAVAAVSTQIANESWVSNEITFVIDNTAPTIALSGGSTITHEAGCCLCGFGR